MKTLQYGLIVIIAGLALASLGGCSVIDTHSSSAFPVNTRWVLLPMLNNAQTPRAGASAEAITATLLRQRGINRLIHYPRDTAPSGLPALDRGKRLQQALEWAREQGIRYGVGGVVTEWRYRTGLDGEPSVGVTLQVYDIATGQVTWSASGAASGWGDSSLSGTAQELLAELVSRMPLRR